MRTLKGLTLVAATIVLLLAAQGIAAGPTSAPSVYTVGVRDRVGVDTGLVLHDGLSVSVTATGAACPYEFDESFCVGPDGNPGVDTTQSFWEGFSLPGAPAWGLVGRVGDGPWAQVGSGPTTLSGNGVLVFGMNDDLFRDNWGGFEVTVTVSYACWPGHGYGDANHDHTGPPGLDPDACYPGYGYGDSNHDHAGPPGLDPASPPPGQGPAATHGNSSEHSNSQGNGNSGEHGNSQANGSSNGHGGTRQP